RRLATRVGSTLAGYLPATDGVQLLDIGCGRGGPAIHLADRFGFRVTGLDLVPYNVTRATENAREQGSAAEFVVGDATQLPFASDSFPACTAIDSLVYLPDRATVFAEISRVLEPDGIVVLSDLLRRPDVDPAEREAIASFADAWDMPPLGTLEEYRQAFDGADLTLRECEDITRHGIGRFRKWTGLFLGLRASPMGPLVERSLRRYGLDPSTITDQVERAHRVLPSLQHVILVAHREG
ncbi:MAG: class I SAM-dependent methyltransferase, partial [Halobacteriales archaeon]|nr:class I SAM-dependent methyltransferase [Halobacteriales archaeon]